jgi:PhnB protein
MVRWGHVLVDGKAMKTLTRAALSPHLTVADVQHAAKFYEAAFGFLPKMMMPGRGGRIMHGELVLDGVRLMLGPESADRGMHTPKTSGRVSPVSLYLSVGDVDAVHAQALAAGAQELMAPSEQFFGARTSMVMDPDGHQWMLSQQKEVLSSDELKAALKPQPLAAR